MKARFFAIAALVLGLASCQKDFAPEANLGGEVDFTLAVTAPELSKTRAGVDGAVDTNNAMDSAFGAIDYLDGYSCDLFTHFYSYPASEKATYGIVHNSFCECSEKRRQEINDSESNDAIIEK